MKQQKGFTLIELIIVIVILGILAVAAAPRFFDFSSDARKKALKGLTATMESASSLIYARAAIVGKLDSEIADNVFVDGVKLVYGFPTATAEGIIAAVELPASTLLSSGEDWIYHEDIGVVYFTLASYKKEGTNISLSGCSAYYVAAELPGELPRIGRDLHNC